jgi:hypothetical protein
MTMASDDDVFGWMTAEAAAAPPKVFGFTREHGKPYVCPECGGTTLDGGPPWASMQFADNEDESVLGHGCTEACASANLTKRLDAAKGGA